VYHRFQNEQIGTIHDVPGASRAQATNHFLHDMDVDMKNMKWSQCSLSKQFRQLLQFWS
jgi:hypothetical protein